MATTGLRVEVHGWQYIARLCVQLYSQWIVFRNLILISCFYKLRGLRP